MQTPDCHDGMKYKESAFKVHVTLSLLTMLKECLNYFFPMYILAIFPFSLPLEEILINIWNLLIFSIVLEDSFSKSLNFILFVNNLNT